MNRSNLFLCNVPQWQQLKMEWYLRRTAYLESQQRPMTIDCKTFGRSQAETWILYSIFLKYIRRHVNDSILCQDQATHLKPYHQFVNQFMSIYTKSHNRIHYK